MVLVVYWIFILYKFHRTASLSLNLLLRVSNLAVADLQRMFPTPPSLEHHPAFSPITPYRDTPSQEPPAPSGVADHLPSLASTQITEYKMDLEEGLASPRQDDIKVRRRCCRPHWTRVITVGEKLTNIYVFLSAQPQIGSSMFAPLPCLPSQILPKLKIPEQCYYRPSWALLPKMEHFSPIMHPQIAAFAKDGYT